MVGILRALWYMWGDLDDEDCSWSLYRLCGVDFDLVVWR